MKEQNNTIDTNIIQEKRIEQNLSSIDNHLQSDIEKGRQILNEETICKKGKKPIYEINISMILDEYDQEIENKIKQINDPNLDEKKKRLLVKMLEKTTTYDLDDNSSKKKNDISIEIQKDRQFTKELALKDNSVEDVSFNNVTTDITANITNISDISIEQSQLSVNNNSTIIISPESDCKQDTRVDKEEEKEKSKKDNFAINAARSTYYSKLNLNDVSLNEMNSDRKLPDKYMLDSSVDGQKYIFVCLNDLTTYNITSSAYLLNNNNKNSKDKPQSDKDIDTESLKDYRYEKALGLGFCGKSFEIKGANGIEIKRCTPNEFICKQCMLINKKKYNLDKTFLININGRVAKIKKGSYHCYGHFLIGNQIEDCIVKFKCKACEMLDSLSEYYNS